MLCVRKINTEPSSWISLPPAAVGAGPAKRANTAAATQRISLLRLQNDRDAHAVTMSFGKDRPPEHARRRALVGRELI